MTPRSSHSDPLQIAEVRVHPSYGPIGITFCPGKKQPDAMTGGWDRDLDIDVETIHDWGAAAVVTLVEDHELVSLKVAKLGDAVRHRHMAWHHLPIPDGSPPGDSFEANWAREGEELRARLRDGFGILIHCKGGLGRAGTLAGRLLVELGVQPDAAVNRVRQVRPGAIETLAQETHVLGLVHVPEPTPDTSDEAIRDRAVGALLGLAVGDALGTTLEFKTRDTYAPINDMVGGGPFRLRPGEWTDDTAMALALADSLRGRTDLDEADLMRRFVQWYDRGTYSCTGKCFDIGVTTREALHRYKGNGDPIAGSTNPNKAGNGSLMRLSPVAIRFWRDRDKLKDVAARQSRTTHGAPEAVDACVAYAEAIADAIEGRRRSEVMRERIAPFAGKIANVMAGSWRGRHRDEVSGSGYVAHALEASLWSIGRTGTFGEAVLLAANLGDDADTTAAITGQLAGALYGESGIPGCWRERVAWGHRITRMAEGLLEPVVG